MCSIPCHLLLCPLPPLTALSRSCHARTLGSFAPSDRCHCCAHRGFEEICVPWYGVQTPLSIPEIWNTGEIGRWTEAQVASRNLRKRLLTVERESSSRLSCLSRIVRGLTIIGQLTPE
ncbi:hypothetical protein BDV10DRAFT_154326 [Aspergillus recurvatus]